MSTPTPTGTWEHVAESMERAAARLEAVGADLERQLAYETSAVANRRRPSLALIEGGKEGGPR